MVAAVAGPMLAALREPFTILDKIDRRGAGRPGVILHRMWVDGTEFRWDKEPVVA